MQNADYDSLKKIIELEKNHELENAKKNPKNYDSILASDLMAFESSEDLRGYLKQHDDRIDKTKAISIGWLFVLISDLALICVHFFQYVGIHATKGRDLIS